MSALYAMIRPTSEYSHQSTDKPFPVQMGDPPYDGAVVSGGPGGHYRLTDIFLYVDMGDEQLHLMPGQFETDEAVPSFDKAS